MPTAVYGDGVVTGSGTVDGRQACVFAQDSTVHGGSMGEAFGEKVVRTMVLALKIGCPVSTHEEQAGIIRRGAKLLYAHAEATVPKVTVVVRRAYGGGYAVMGSKDLGADVNLAWPTARIAVMGAERAVGVLHCRELAAATAVGERAVAELRAKLVEEYETVCGPPYAAARGYTDAVIEPRTTRAHLARALRCAPSVLPSPTGDTTSDVSSPPCPRTPFRMSPAHQTQHRTT